MSKNNVILRTSMLAEFREGKNASQTHKLICAEYGDDIISVKTVQQWFRKFRKGDFNLLDDERSGRPSEIDDSKIIKLIEENPRSSLKTIAETVNVSKSSVLTHLGKHGYVRDKDNDIWILRKTAEN